MRRLALYAIVAAISLVLSVLVVEIGLRVLGVAYPRFYVQDSQLGSALRPGAEGLYRAEGRSWISVNSGGLRDRPHEIAKPAGVYRVAVLGDSMAEALQVPREQNFCSLMEQRLRNCAALGGKQPEVLNFGVSGYGTGQELIMLRERVWQYQPDFVLLAMFPGNDIRNNDAALNGDPSCPYFSLQNGALAVKNPVMPPQNGLRSLRDTLVDHSRALQLIYQARKGMRAHASDQMVARGTDPKQVGEAGVDDATFAPPKTGDWEEAWRVTEALLVQMRDEVRAHGAAFAVALIPSGIQNYPDASVRQAYARKLGVEDLSYAHHRLEEFAHREGIPVVPLEAPFRNYAENQHTMLHGFSNTAMGFGHMNENGHKLAAEILSAHICQK